MPLVPNPASTTGSETPYTARRTKKKTKNDPFCLGTKRKHTPHHKPCGVVSHCVCVCVCVCLVTLSVPPYAHPLTPFRIRDRNRSSNSNNTPCVCMCVCACCCWLGGPKRGPFLGTSGRTWDMKKNSWAPKLFYDNMPAHGGSTPQSAVWHDDGLIHVGPSGSKRNAPCSV
jgi:hypothetical protein